MMPTRPAGVWRGARLLRACLLPVAIACATFAAIGPAVAACEDRGLVVAGSATEADSACAGLADVLAYFKGLGYALDLRLTITFKSRVMVEIGGSSAAGLPVTGVYHVGNASIEMTSPDSPTPARRRLWNVDWGGEIAHSVIEHEFVHAAVDAIDPEGIEPVWNEFVGYAVMFELMAPDLRTRILATYPGVAAFAGRGEVCDGVYMADPDLFAVRSYLFAEANGGPDYVRRVLSGDVSQKPSRRNECPLWEK